MKPLSKHEEDYLKTIFYLFEKDPSQDAGSKELAAHLDISAASVSGMLKKLKEKGLVDHLKYGKISLTKDGKAVAINLIRKHRLWETFLHQHMNFSWDEVHDVAEQLEHIRSIKLIRELDRFLGFPERDPHGDPIPDESGNYHAKERLRLSSLAKGDVCRLVSVDDGSVSFLRYVSDIGLALSSEIKVIDLRSFDGSMFISYDGREENVSQKFADSIYVERC